MAWILVFAVAAEHERDLREFAHEKIDIRPARHPRVIATCPRHLKPFEITRDGDSSFICLRRLRKGIEPAESLSVWSIVWAGVSGGCAIFAHDFAGPVENEVIEIAATKKVKLAAARRDVALLVPDRWLVLREASARR